MIHAKIIGFSFLPLPISSMNLNAASLQIATSSAPVYPYDVLFFARAEIFQEKESPKSNFRAILARQTDRNHSIRLFVDTEKTRIGFMPGKYILCFVKENNTPRSRWDLCERGFIGLVYFFNHEALLCVKSDGKITNGCSLVISIVGRFKNVFRVIQQVRIRR
mmetsp:Transcript_11993/g.25561  ORF Transcript_11993/g.25561 Transcript_11993/m.25561 type:complete len:163 (+) Transcript_11993:1024-1512(+)